MKTRMTVILVMTMARMTTILVMTMARMTTILVMIMARMTTILMMTMARMTTILMMTMARMPTILVMTMGKMTIQLGALSIRMITLLHIQPLLLPQPPVALLQNLRALVQLPPSPRLCLPFSHQIFHLMSPRTILHSFLQSLRSRP